MNTFRGILDLQVETVLRALKAQQDSRCRGIERAAASRAEKLLSDSRRRMRQRVHTAVVEERRRRETALLDARHRIETAERLRIQQQYREFLEEALPLLAAGLEERWQDAEEEQITAEDTDGELDTGGIDGEVTVAAIDGGGLDARLAGIGIGDGQRTAGADVIASGSPHFCPSLINPIRWGWRPNKRAARASAATGSLLSIRVFFWTTSVVLPPDGPLRVIMRMPSIRVNVGLKNWARSTMVIWMS